MESTFPTRSFSWPHNACRIWSGADTGPQTRYFRREFDLAEGISSARLLLYAEARVHLWCNGQYIARGPLLHHPNHRNVQEIQLAQYLHPGSNVIAIAAHTPDVSLQNCVLSREPGPVARLSLTFHLHPELDLVTDHSWKATDKTGWITPVPRRNWALGTFEVLDASVAPFGWQYPGFDDAAWNPADCFPPTALPRVQWQVPDLMPFEWKHVPVPQPPQVHLTPAQPPLLHPEQGDLALGRLLLEEPWSAVPEHSGIQVQWNGQGALEITGLSSENGLALVFDLGCETVGQIVFECDCESSGVIDIAWSEVMHGDRPWFFLKGTSYVDRLLAKPGTQSWEPMSYSGGRFFCLILRKFTGSARFSNLGMRSTRLAVDCSGASFHSSNKTLNGIWEIAKRTLEICPQDSLTDCPSREQACYLSDSPLAAEWLSILSGDRRLWRHTIREVFLRPGANGLLKDAVYSPGLRSLADFNLIAVMLLARYVRQTGDLSLAREVLPAAEGAVHWFTSQLNSGHLLPIDWLALREEQPGAEPFFTGNDLPALTPWLFIDHPGMGWHNHGDPGIDRSGMNAAIHALLVLALEALAQIHELLGDTPLSAHFSSQASVVRAAAAQMFFDPSKGVFADGFREGKLLAQISQQANTLCLLAGFCDAETSKAVVSRILGNDPDTSRNGPYMWNFLLESMSRYGLQEEALTQMVQLWGAMLERGATSVWETFAGDHLDSWCHPWSAGPAYFIPRHILGLHAAHCAGGALELRPRYDLLNEASGSLPCANGIIRIAWKPGNGTVRLEGSLPEGVEATLYDALGQPLGQVSGNWLRELPPVGR